MGLFDRKTYRTCTVCGGEIRSETVGATRAFVCSTNGNCLPREGKGRSYVVVDEIEKPRALEGVALAMQVIDEINSMDFGVFVTLVEEHNRSKLPKEAVEGWRFFGLNNIDFFKAYGVFETE